MKLVTAIIKPFKMDDVREELSKPLLVQLIPGKLVTVKYLLLILKALREFVPVKQMMTRFNQLLLSGNEQLHCLFLA